MGWIKINGKKIKVVIVEEEEGFDVSRYGESDLFKFIIKINSRLAPEAKIQTLLHEVIHFWNEDFALGLNADDQDSHDLIERLSSLFFIFCQENNVNLNPLLAAINENKKRKVNGKV
ncbi:hypothetical protein [Caldisericum sp.]|uniref:hypothetical protein n=1 Tax=Caldisericum sp. TaxID=2499687 RepID=UPI003D136C4B